MICYQKISNTSLEVQKIIESNYSKTIKLKKIWVILEPIVKYNIYKSIASKNISLTDDLIQDCFIVLSNCFNDYNKEKFGVLFVTYYFKWINYEINKFYNIYTAGGICKSPSTISKFKLNSRIDYIDDKNNSLDSSLIISMNDNKLDTAFFEEYMSKNYSSNLDCYIFELIYFNNFSDDTIATGFMIPINEVKSSRRRLRKFILRNKDILKQFL